MCKLAVTTNLFKRSYTFLRETSKWPNPHTIENELNNWRDDNITILSMNKKQTIERTAVSDVEHLDNFSRHIPLMKYPLYADLRNSLVKAYGWLTCIKIGANKKCTRQGT